MYTDINIKEILEESNRPKFKSHNKSEIGEIEEIEEEKKYFGKFWNEWINL